MKNVFSERLYECRKEKGLSQTALAEILGVQQSCISKWERGATAPDPEDIAKICKILDVSSDYLLGLKDF